MKTTTFNSKNLAFLVALATFLIVPGMAHASCQVSAASAFPSSVPAAGTTGAVAISAPAGCPWTFTARGVSWVRILSATTGSGPAVIYYQILPNTTRSVRSATFGPEGATAQSTQYIGTRSSTVTQVSQGFSVTITQP
jgi:hypothetical protein